MSTFADRLAAVRERMEAAEARAGRAAGSATLVAIGKTHPPEALREAVAAGAAVLGENKVQEAFAKAPEVPGARWHLVGRLQRNKARRAAEVFTLIHTLDSGRLAERLDRIGIERGRVVEALVQVNLSREASKAGVFEEDVPSFLDACAGRPGLAVRGLMTIPEPPERPEDSRADFARLRALAEVEEARGREGISLEHLSMGMTDDFEIAIEEGATLVRVGRALFGPRLP